MEFEQILELVDRVAASGLGSFVYETPDMKLALKAGTDGAAEEPGDNGIRKAGSGTGGRMVTSPLVGTFYAAPSEGADPYVKVGDSVRKGQILGIVEAMKLMNEIESDYDGVVSRILVENGAPVEYGQPLFCLEV